MSPGPVSLGSADSKTPAVRRSATSRRGAFQEQLQQEPPQTCRYQRRAARAEQQGPQTRRAAGLRALPRHGRPGTTLWELSLLAPGLVMRAVLRPQPRVYRPGDCVPLRGVPRAPGAREGQLLTLGNPGALCPQEGQRPELHIIFLSSFLEIRYLTCFLKAFKPPARFQLPGGEWFRVDCP